MNISKILRLIKMKIFRIKDFPESVAIGLAWGVSISFTPLEMIGALYVVEGSLLGGAVIGKQLSENKNLDYNINSMQFYTYSNEERRARWKATLKLLKEDYTTSEIDEIVMGAIKTFNHFINIMT